MKNMKKMMLVIDEPGSCADCMFCYTPDVDPVCMATLKRHEVSPDADNLRDWNCPLQSMPETPEVPKQPEAVSDISFRDYFAGQALTSFRIEPEWESPDPYKRITKEAYIVADAMLAERARISEVEDGI